MLRYPKEKENITHINYEPWHFRYVGKEVANYLYENGLVLEELEKYLKERYTIPVKNENTVSSRDRDYRGLS